MAFDMVMAAHCKGPEGQMHDGMRPRCQSWCVAYLLVYRMFTSRSEECVFALSLKFSCVLGFLSDGNVGFIRKFQYEK